MSAAKLEMRNCLAGFSPLVLECRNQGSVLSNGFFLSGPNFSINIYPAGDGYILRTNDYRLNMRYEN